MITPERFSSPRSSFTPRAGPKDVENIVEPTTQSLNRPSRDRKKIILDCDPGHDDAVALLLAHGNPDIDLLAVTTVVGNQTLEKVTRNALAVATIAGITGVPFAAGCSRPLVRSIATAPDIHGESGMDGPALPESIVELDPRHAVDLIIDTVMAHEPGTVTLVPTAGLTNIAMAARKEPRIVERVKEVVLMGGGYHVGNWSAVAEFNIIIDPEAAHIVFNEKWPVVMVGLDLTHQALATPDVVGKIAALGTKPAKFVTELMDFFAHTYKDAQGFDFPPVHDPCAVAYVIDPSIVSTRKVPVNIELQGTLTLGMTVADFRAPAPVDCHTSVAVNLDHERFWHLVTDALERIGEPGSRDTNSEGNAADVVRPDSADVTVGGVK
jgi:purine nucleosidase